MGAGKVIGGLLALVGGVLILVACFGYYMYHITDGIDYQMIRWIIHLIAALLAVIGGVLAIASKGAGGVLVLIAGILAFLIPLFIDLIAEFPYTYWFSPYAGLANLVGWGSFLFTDIGLAIIYSFTFEGIIIFVGSILILSSRDRD